MGNKSYCLFVSYREDFWGKIMARRQWLQTRIVLHQCSVSCVGRENGAVRWVCPDPVLCSGWNPQVLLAAPTSPPGS